MHDQFKQRRLKLLEKMEGDSTLVVSSPSEKFRNGDTTFPFRASSDVHYLSGCVEPKTTVVLKKTKSKKRSIVFVQPKNKEREIWDGRRLGVSGAIESLGFDDAYPSHELGKQLPSLLSGSENLYVLLGEDSAFDNTILNAIKTCRHGQRKGLEPIKRVVDSTFTLHEMRLIKTPLEIEKLREAAKISCSAHCLAMQAAQDGVYEYQIASLLDYEFRKQGCSGPGYQSIVGTGENATILHYVENSSVLKNGELLLIDAGGEFDFYTADITRTFPVSGSFTSPQKDIYALVLKAQKQAIDMIRPGVTIDDIHDLTVRVLTHGMIDLGFLSGKVDDRIADKSYRKYYMHRTSHWLGMDVHDVGLYYKNGQARPLESGMVITVEPGLYVSHDESGIQEGYRGIGVRVEDDVLVTNQGREVLTHHVPKEIKDIENLCRKNINILLV